MSMIIIMAGRPLSSSSRSGSGIISEMFQEGEFQKLMEDQGVTAKV